MSATERGRSELGSIFSSHPSVTLDLPALLLTYSGSPARIQTNGPVASLARTPFPHLYDGRILPSWQGRCEEKGVLNRVVAQLDVGSRKITLVTLWKLHLSGVEKTMGSRSWPLWTSAQSSGRKRENDI